MAAVPRFALPVVLAVLLVACGDDGDAATPTSPSPSPQVTSTTSSDSPETPSSSPPPGAVRTESTPPGPARCTLALGMSVTRDWFELGAFESLPGVEDARWELIWASGHDLLLFADPSAEPYALAPISPCAEEPDRVLFQIAAVDWTAPGLADQLRASIENIRATWPTVEVVEVVPIVGGPSGAPCRSDEAKDGVLPTVAASLMNPVMNEVIAEVADGSGVRAGPNLLLGDCAQYRDATGHLAPDGAALVAARLAEYYGT